MKSFFAPGKLMLSGEYSVLQGAHALAVPTKRGQHLKVEAYAKNDLRYSAYDDANNLWLDFHLSEAKSEAEILVRDILYQAMEKEALKGWHLSTKLDFPRAWGLGSSSTFISLIAQWTEHEVWPLFFKFLKGSGYDVAVAEERASLMYQLEEEHKPSWTKVEIPKFFKDTALVYLGQKQNSANEVKRFLSKKRSATLVEEISSLSLNLLKLGDRKELAEWMIEHESKTAELIGRSPVPPLHLPKIEGQAKSLGAWGGDFIWLSHAESIKTVQKNGFPDAYPFYKLVED